MTSHTLVSTVNVRALLFAEDIAPFVEGRPAAAYARRVAPDYPGRLRAVLPPEWLGPLRDASTAGSRDGDAAAGAQPHAMPVAR